MYMLRPCRAKMLPARLLAAITTITTITCAAIALPQDGDTTERVTTYRKVHLFDFAERDLGNFEDTPMHWVPFSGPGLPPYSTGRFDNEAGYEAPPSFHYHIRGGSIGFEYARDDLAISPESDYLVEGYIRCQGLEFARAFIVCYLVDQLGDPIPRSEAVSPFVNGTSDPPDDWQRVTIEVPVDNPLAYAMRLQLWVLQDYAWQEPDANVPDPIIRQDVNAHVWFDDIAIYRMPRVRLAISNPGGVVAPETAEHLTVAVHNATLAHVDIELSVTDVHGVKRFSEIQAVDPLATRRFETPVPNLPPGHYEAHARLGTNVDTLVERTIQFDILPEIIQLDTRCEDIGIDLGRWAGGSVDGVIELVDELGCGAARLGVAMIGAPRDYRETHYLEQIRDLVHLLAINRVETTGIILQPGAIDTNTTVASTYSLLTGDRPWDSYVGPVFAYLGDLLFSWQLGEEAIELHFPDTWSADAIRSVRSQLERFIAVPQLVVPRSVLDTTQTRLLPEFALARDPSTTEQAPPTDDAGPDTDTDDQTPSATASQRPHAYSFHLPGSIPAQAFPWHLAFWFENSTDRAFEGLRPDQTRSEKRGPAHWITLGIPNDLQLTTTDQIADLARRVILAKAVNPDRLYVPAPFALSGRGGELSWQPTAEFIPLRTLFHYLSGRRAIAALQLDDQSVALLFRGTDHSCLVLWTWRLDHDDVAADLYVGASAYAIDLSGERLQLERNGLQAHIPLSNVPLIIEDVDAPLLLLQDSFVIEPASIQLHEPDLRPTMRLRNFYPQELTGTAELRPPPSWQVTPNPTQVHLRPGEALEQPLNFAMPPRQIASAQIVAVDFHLVRPKLVDLHFEVPISIELRDIVVTASAWWDNDDLVVEQVVQSMAPQAVSFTAFCQAPDRALQEGVFLEVAPGDTRVQTYRFRNSRDLAGAELWLGIQEIDGRRALDQLVDVPR